MERRNKRNKSLPFFRIADINCADPLKFKNQVTEDDRFQLRNRRNYSQNCLLALRSSLYPKLDPSIARQRFLGKGLPSQITQPLPTP